MGTSLPENSRTRLAIDKRACGACTRCCIRGYDAQYGGGEARTCFSSRAAKAEYRGMAWPDAGVGFASVETPPPLKFLSRSRAGGRVSGRLERAVRTRWRWRGLRKILGQNSPVLGAGDGGKERLLQLFAKAAVQFGMGLDGGPHDDLAAGIELAIHNLRAGLEVGEDGPGFLLPFLLLGDKRKVPMPDGSEATHNATEPGSRPEGSARALIHSYGMSCGRSSASALGRGCRAPAPTTMGVPAPRPCPTLRGLDARSGALLPRPSAREPCSLGTPSVGAAAPRHPRLTLTR